MMMKSDLRIVFMGTPDFAIPSLEMLLREGYRVEAVITQPDRMSGRGHKTLPPPVKEFAIEHGIQVFQFEKLSKEGAETIRGLNPNLLITAAYGQIISQEILDIPEFGCINVHGSLLPKYRGAAPIEWSVIDGERVTGITTLMTVFKLDAGDMLEKDETVILPDETGGELRERLSHLGARTLSRTLVKLCDGTLRRTPQNESEATSCSVFKKGFGKLNALNSCADIVNLVRGLNPAPCAYFMEGDNRVRVLTARKYSDDMTGQPGRFVAADSKQGLLLQAGDGIVELVQIKYPGGKAMNAKDFLRGKGQKIAWDNLMLTAEEP